VSVVDGNIDVCDVLCVSLVHHAVVRSVLTYRMSPALNDYDGALVSARRALASLDILVARHNGAVAHVRACV
jgi:hypothetical protein